MSRVLWSFMTRKLSAALIGCALLKELAKTADSYGELELNQDLKNHAIMFEDIAIGVIGVCYNANKTDAHNLLVRQMPDYGNKTLFSLSNSYRIMAFMDTSCCQTKLSLLWKGHMAPYTPLWKMIICIFLPIFISPCITFPESSVTRMRKIIYFYKAPIVIFITYTLSYLVFLATFTLFVLTDLRHNKVSFLEAVFGDGPLLFYWMKSDRITWQTILSRAVKTLITIFVAVSAVFGPLELSLMLVSLNKGSPWFKIRNWFDSIWNRCDLAMYTLFVIAVVVRFSVNENGFNWARSLYSISLASFIIRILQNFLVQKQIGPKVIVLRNMLKDVLLFFGIFFVFLVSFGVMYQANLYPNAPKTWSLLKSIVYVPYWQIYGELFLDEMGGALEGDCTTNETIWRQADGLERCPEHRHLVQVLAALYLLMSNIILVNLLIAMFSTTYQKVHDKSELIWRYYRYDAVHTLYHNPLLCPPLNIFALSYRILRCIFSKTPLTNDFSKQFTDDEMLDNVESEACVKYLKTLEEPQDIKGRPENAYNICRDHRPPYCGCFSNGYTFGPTSIPTSILLRNPEQYGY